MFAKMFDIVAADLDMPTVKETMQDWTEEDEVTETEGLYPRLPEITEDCDTTLRACPGMIISPILLKQEEQHARKVKELREELDKAIKATEGLAGAVLWLKDVIELEEDLWNKPPDMFPTPTSPLVEIGRSKAAAVLAVFSQATEATA